MNDDKTKIICSKCNIPDFVTKEDVSNFPKDFKCRYCGADMKLNTKENK